MNKAVKILLVIASFSVITILVLIYVSNQKTDSFALIQPEKFEEAAVQPFYRTDDPEKNEKVYQALYKEVVGNKVRVLVNNFETQNFDEMFFILPEEISVLHRVMKNNNKYEDSKIVLAEVPKNSPIFLLAREGEEAEIIEIVWLDWSASNN